MKRSIYLFILLFTFLVTACTAAPEATPTTTPTSMANEIYTIVAQIMESQATPIPPTATPAPSATAIQTPTKTENHTIPSSGATAPQTVSYSSYVCDDSLYVSDVTISDYTEIIASEAFTKTWMLQNNGTCAWTETYTVNYISGTSMSGVSTAIGQSVVSGGTVEVSVELTAPETAGTYTGYWQLSNDTGTSFGASFFVLIVVPETVTSTPTVTSEYTATATARTDIAESTSTATSTATATATTVPEATNTPTAVPTSTAEGSIETD